MERGDFVNQINFSKSRRPIGDVGSRALSWCLLFAPDLCDNKENWPRPSLSMGLPL